MSRWIGWSVGSLEKLNVVELLQAPRQGGVIRDRQLNIEHLCQATEEALGLTKRKARP